MNMWWGYPEFRKDLVTVMVEDIRRGDGKRLWNASEWNFRYIRRTGNPKGGQEQGRSKNAGSKHSKSKLSESDVVTIRRDDAAGVPKKTQARKYGVGYSVIANIVARRAWKHVA